MIKVVKKPWGQFEIIYQAPEITVKILTVNPKSSRLSLQSHQLRDEIWMALDDGLFCQEGDRIYEMSKGGVYTISRKTKHRLSGGDKGGRILEVSFGKFDENDIIRYEDDYGRKP